MNSIIYELYMNAVSLMQSSSLCLLGVNEEVEADAILRMNDIESYIQVKNMFIQQIHSDVPNDDCKVVLIY